ncbi:MAG: cobalamin-binding protein [Nevskia sp.]
MRAVVVLALLLALPAGAAERVVTLAPHLAELACAAGGCAKLVGVCARSDYPPDVAALPQIGDAFAVNLEAVLALKPDLVLAWDGGTPPDRVARLRKLGLRVEWVRVNHLDEIGSVLEQVGAWLGTAEAAQVAAQAYRQRLAALRVQHRDDAPIRAVYQIETAPAYTINRSSPISEAMAICGGVNVFADLPHIADSVGAESMLAAAPEVVLFGGEENAASIQAYWKRLSAAPAARRGNLYAIDANLLGRATPRLLDGIEAVCRRFDEARARRQ